MIINGVDLTTLGWVPGPRQWPKFGTQRKVQGLATRPGGYASGVLIPPGTLSVSGVLMAPTHAELLARCDELLGLLGVGTDRLLTIQFSDYPDREWYGYLDPGSTQNDFTKSYLTQARTFALDFSLPDPRAFARALTTAPVSDGVSQPLSLGSAPSDLRLELIATGTPTVTLHGADSATPVRRLAFRQAPASSSVVLDSSDGLTLIGAAAQPDALAPGSQPVVASVAEGGTHLLVTGASGLLSYRKTWW